MQLNHWMHDLRVIKQKENKKMFGDFENIYKVFRQDDRLVAANGTLMKNKIFELASGLDEDFLQLLLDNDITKKIV